MPQPSFKRKSPDKERLPDIKYCEFNFRVLSWVVYTWGLIFNLFHTLLGSVYPRVIFNLFYTLLGSLYLRVIFDLSYILLGSVYLRVIFNLFHTLLSCVYLRGFF